MDSDPTRWLTLVAAVIAALSLLWAAVGWVLTRPRRPVAGPTTMDLGSEPPAIVDLLTDDFDVTTQAVPATLVDLAARRWLSIEEVGGGNVVIRLAARDRADPLTSYERRVLEHVRGLAVDGVVPAAAMTTGPGAASRRWWRAFRREVIRDAQARGLCRDRWSTPWLSPIWLGTVASGIALWAAEKTGRPTDGAAQLDVDGWLWSGTVVVVLALGLWSFSVLRRELQRDTPAGLQCASTWLGVREHLATVGDFGDKPAAMVAIWDRYLAHAVALDLAPLVVTQLPLGAEDHRHAWSRSSGTWRHVRVRYPVLRPGYGQHPIVAVLGAALAGAVAATVLVVAVRARTHDIALVRDLPDEATRPVDIAALVVATCASLVLAWNSVKLVYGLSDVFATRQCEGVLLRARIRRGWVGLTDTRQVSSDDGAKERFFCAIDTGRGGTLTAWRVRSSIYGRMRQGDRYIVSVSPRLGYVRTVRPVDPEPAQAGAPGGRAE